MAEPAPPPPAYADPPSPAQYSDEEYASSQPEEDEEVSQETEDRDDETHDESGDEDGDADETGEQGGDGDEAGERRPRPPRRSRPPRDYRHLRLKSAEELALLTDPEVASTVREIGRTASWSLSTAKPGNGVDQLRDFSLDTYWQSDGLQPHHINIQFPRRQTVCAIALYMDFNLDESYTPKRMKVKVGTTFHNLEEVRTVDVREPVGWVTIPLWRKFGEDPLDGVLDPAAAEDNEANGGGRRVPPWRRRPLRTHLVQISILSMHQNGRDTHVRQVKIFGPRDYGGAGGTGGNAVLGQRGMCGRDGREAGKGDKVGGDKLAQSGFQTVGMAQFSAIR